MTAMVRCSSNPFKLSRTICSTPSTVAATGLPVAQPNHALLMGQCLNAALILFVSYIFLTSLLHHSSVKFARDILVKTGRLTTELEGKLGPDTSELAMRVGLHSGPVTAGVLRGQKARFQLFGDTM